MPRVFIQSHCITDDKVTLKDNFTVHHFKNVLRVRHGERQVVVDQNGTVYHTTIERVSSAGIVLKIENKIPKADTKSYSLTIACALPKQSKMEDLIDALTQLGVDRIIPMRTQRVIVKLDKDSQRKKLERWEKIAQSAAGQSQRDNIPVVESPATFESVLKTAASFDLKLIPALIEERVPLKEILARTKPKDILVLIGPEGDFTLPEVRLAKDAGFIPVSLGKEVLRVATAAIAVASFIHLYLEE